MLQWLVSELLASHPDIDKLPARLVSIKAAAGIQVGAGAGLWGAEPRVLKSAAGLYWQEPAAEACLRPARRALVWRYRADMQTVERL